MNQEDDQCEYGKVIKIREKEIIVRGKNKKGGFVWWAVPHTIERREDVARLNKKMRDKIVKVYKYQDEYELFVLTSEGSESIEEFFEQDQSRDILSFQQEEKKREGLISSLTNNKGLIKDLFVTSILILGLFY